MQYFKRVELPEWCYPLEVVYWLTFGRLPPYMGWEFEDARRSKDRILEVDEPAMHDLAFFAEEFRAMGVEINYERYDAIRSEHTETSKEYTERRERIFAQFPKLASIPEFNPMAEVYASFHQQGAEELAEIEWAEEMESEMSGALDISRGEILRELRRGGLLAEGWLPNVDDLEAKEVVTEADVKFVAIPASDWARKSFNWTESELPIRNGAFRHVMVSTENMFKCFPSPNATSTEVTAQLFPGVAIIEGGGTRQTRARIAATRGRKPIGDGLVQKAFGNHYRKMLKQGSKWAKEDTLIAEMTQWVSEHFGEEHTPKRTAMQKWLKAEAGTSPLKPATK